MAPSDQTRIADAALSVAAGGLRLQVRLHPGASANRIDGFERRDDGQSRLRARVTVAPEKGKANKALIALLAAAWRIPKSDFTIVAGISDRQKTLAIAGHPAALKAKILGQA